MVMARKDMSKGLLVEDAWVFTDLSKETPAELTISIHEGRIAALGSKEEMRQRFPQAESISLPGYLVMPGLINAHMHASMSFFRGLGQAQGPNNKRDSSMIENFFFPAEQSLTPDLIEALSYPYLVDALKSGTTSCVDAYFFIDGVAKALERLGMRGFIGEHIADQGGPHPAGKETWHHFRNKIENWPYSSRVKPVVYAHATDTVSKGLLQELGQFAKANALPFHMHLSQTWGERERVINQTGMSPVRLAYEAGVIHDRSLLVHLVSADRADLELISQQGALVGLCPVSEIIYENLPDLKNFFELKMRIALGTDCAASNDGADLLNEARSMALLARHSGFPLSAFDLGAMVLGEAAQLLAPRDLGSIDVGKAADFVCIRLGIETYPWTRSLTNLFFSGVSRQVEHVMIDGHWVLWSRQLVQVSESDLIEEFEKALGQLRMRSSLPI